MTDSIQITRKNYWQVNGTNHSSQEEAFQDAASQAVAMPGSIVQVQPPAYTVTYTAPVATQPPPVSPPPPPPSDPPSDGTTNIGAWQDGDPVQIPEDA
jgi:hypothetical protein